MRKENNTNRKHKVRIVRSRQKRNERSSPVTSTIEQESIADQAEPIAVDSQITREKRASEEARSNTGAEFASQGRYDKFRQLVIKLEKDPVVRLTLAALLILTALQLSIDLFDRRDERGFRAEEREFRVEEQIARSWNNLSNPNTSASAKVAAMEYLYSRGESFRGIDLSCETLGLGWDDETLSCRRPLDLTGLNIASPDSEIVLTESVEVTSQSEDESVWLRSCASDEMGGPGMIKEWSDRIETIGEGKRDSDVEHARSAIRQSGADFRLARLSGVNFGNADVSGANFSNADLRGARFFRARAEAAQFDGADLAAAKVIESNFRGATFHEIGEFSDWRSMFAKDWIQGSVQLRPEFTKTKLDASVFFSAGFRRDFYLFEGVSLRNSELSLNTTRVGFESVECNPLSDVLIGGWRDKCSQPEREDIKNSDLTCAIFYQDDGVNLNGSNISRAWFPSRFSSTSNFGGYGNSEQQRPSQVRLVSISGLVDPTWSPNNLNFEAYTASQPPWDPAYAPPWSFSDTPPIGNLTGEFVRICDPLVRERYGHGAFHSTPYECQYTANEAGNMLVELKAEYLIFPEPESDSVLRERKARLEEERRAASVLNLE